VIHLSQWFIRLCLWLQYCSRFKIEIKKTKIIKSVHYFNNVYYNYVKEIYERICLIIFFYWQAIYELYQGENDLVEDLNIVKKVRLSKTNDSILNLLQYCSQRQSLINHCDRCITHLGHMDLSFVLFSIF
jgi:hypothetical protein